MLIDVKRIQKDKYTPCVILAILTAGLLLFPATPGFCIDFITCKVFGAEIIKGRLVALAVLLGYYFIVSYNRSVEDRIVIAANLFVFPLVLFIMLLPGNGLNWIPYCFIMNSDVLTDYEAVTAFDLIITCIVGYWTQISFLARFGADDEVGSSESNGHEI